jgi:thiamine-monophosphate kinase
LLTEASGVSAVIDEEKIPLDPSVRSVASSLKRPVMEVANIGGDYELLVAIPPKKAKAAQAAVNQVGGKLTFIGKLTGQKGARKQNVLVSGTRTRPMPNIGWDAFSPEP